MKKNALLIFTAFVCLALAGCTGIDSPYNPQPVIEMLPASDIARNEAVVSARIVAQGNGKLSYFRFCYGETGSSDLQMIDANSDAAVISVTLHGLRPGASYLCYAEGGTATATLRSETINFTTIPNSLPSLTAARPLSTGPIGIIVGFDITEDGGDPIQAAGCEIEELATGRKARVWVPDDELSPGTKRVGINGLTLETSYKITPFASNAIGEARGGALDYTTGNSVLLENPGELEDLLGTTIDLNRLVISGAMNGDDFRFLRQVLGAPSQFASPVVKSAVTAVDLTDVSIVAGGDSYDGSRFTVADEVSTGLFADCISLRNIQLPSSVTCMARDAFAGCSALEILTIPAGVVAILPSGGCTALRAIEVSDANPCYASVDGVLFNSAVTEILWFPLGKTGEYTLPATITAIGESAFAGTSISGLTVPPSVTAISRGAFAGSALVEITLPDNLANVAESMFQNCTSLATVHLGRGTEYIGNLAFDGTALTNLYIDATIPPVVANEAFVNKSTSITATCTLHVPAGCKKYYRNHSRWSLFQRIEEF